MLIRHFAGSVFVVGAPVAGCPRFDGGDCSVVFVELESLTNLAATSTRVAERE